MIELHAYACETGRARRRSWPSGCGPSWPRSGRRWPGCGSATCGPGWRREAPAFTPGSHAGRPGVRTDATRRSYLAGDGIGTDFPSALMERAAATGILAANHILRAEGGAAEPVRSVRPRGLLAKRR